MSSNVPKKNQTDQTVADQKLIDGLTKHAATLPSIVIAGTSTTTAAIVAKLQARIAAISTVQTTRATWRAAVQAERTEVAATKAFVSAVRQALLVAFTGQVDVLADFGLTPRAKHVATPAENLVRAAKSKATRAARHTMGSKQKAEVKGTGTPVVSVTTAPVAVAPVAPATVAPVAPRPIAPVTPAAPPVQPVAAPETVPTTAPATPATSATPAHGA
jgi:hypothetical protein